jgi:hypothetical protein
LLDSDQIAAILHSIYKRLNGIFSLTASWAHHLHKILDWNETMSVLIEAYNVVVMRTTIEEKYVGGLKQYGSDRPNNTYCYDDHLARIGFMVYEEALAFATKLHQVHHFDVQEIALVDQFRGLLAPRAWLEYTQHQDGWALCWLKSTNPTKLAAPVWWNPEKARQNKLQFVLDSEADHLEFLRHENGVDVYRNKNTNELQYVARERTAPDTKQPAHMKPKASF